MTHAVVLIGAERTSIPELGGQLADVEGVAEAFKSDVQNAGFSQVYVIEPGGTHKIK